MYTLPSNMNFRVWTEDAATHYIIATKQKFIESWRHETSRPSSKAATCLPFLRTDCTVNVLTHRIDPPLLMPRGLADKRRSLDDLVQALRDHREMCSTCCADGDVLPRAISAAPHFEPL